MACGAGPRLVEDIEGRRPLIEEERLVQLGYRTLDPPEERMKSSPMRPISMAQLKKRGPRRVAGEVSRVLSDEADWIVSHLDVDVLDTSLVPAVSYPTPGGNVGRRGGLNHSRSRLHGESRGHRPGGIQHVPRQDWSSAKLIVELLSRVSSQLMKGSEGWSFRDCLPFEPPICGFLRRVL